MDELEEIERYKYGATIEQREVPSKIGYSNEPISVLVKVPKSYDKTFIDLYYNLDDLYKQINKIDLNKNIVIDI